MNAQRGQSMTEFAVASGLLALLLLGALSIAGLQQADRRVVQAARQAAWQSAWSLGGADHAAMARSLHRERFSDSAVRDVTGRSLLVADVDLAVEGARRAPSGVAGSAARVILEPLRVASGFLGSGFDLSEGGLMQGAVRARVGPAMRMPAPFDSLELQLRAPFSLLGDAWHAGGVRHVRSRAGGLVPGARLAGLSAIWGPLSAPLAIIEPTLGRLCFGLIEPDRIPEDRLGPGRTPRPGDCP